MLKAASAAIVVSDLSKSYGRVVAVDRVSFAVRAGTTTALLGGNGAGKTTTLSMLLGLLIPTAGRATVLGAKMPDERHRVLPRMNFTSPYVDLPKRLTVAENLAVCADLYGLRHARERIDAVVDDCDLGGFVKRPYGSLSAGQRTRVSLAKAVLNEPDVLLLDEPTASLDPDTADWVRQHLQDYRKAHHATILLASHNMLEVERLCDRVIIMKRGRIEDDDSPDQIMARYNRTTLEEVFLDVARGRAAEAAS